MMTEIARASGIDVLLASIPPSDGFPWRPGIAVTDKIRSLNAWIADYARRAGATFVDYTPALATPEGAMKPGTASDGVHPHAQGDRKSVGEGKSVSVRVDTGGRRIIKTKTYNELTETRIVTEENK